HPRYVSTVDSGNLAGCLLILAQGLREHAASPRASAQLAEGLRDSVLFFREIREDVIRLQAAARERTAALAREIDALDALADAEKRTAPAGVRARLRRGIGAA